IPRSVVSSRMRRNSAGGSTRPDGFDGELRIRSFVLGVIDFSTCSAVGKKSVASVSMNTGLPPAKTTTSGNVTQYGLGISASSPGLISVTTALKICLLYTSDAADER